MNQKNAVVSRETTAFFVYQASPDFGVIARSEATWQSVSLRWEASPGPTGTGRRTDCHGPAALAMTEFFYRMLYSISTGRRGHAPALQSIGIRKIPRFQETGEFKLHNTSNRLSIQSRAETSDQSSRPNGVIQSATFVTNWLRPLAGRPVE